MVTESLDGALPDILKINVWLKVKKDEMPYPAMKVGIVHINPMHEVPVGAVSNVPSQVNDRKYVKCSIADV